jgi:branched-chain amino acid transport system substrate-binding protein
MLSISLLRGSVYAFLVACATAGAAEPVRIGLINELTGLRHRTQSEIAAALAVEEINREGGVLGRPLELLSEDSQGTVPGALLAASKLLAEPALAAIILPPESSQTIAVLPAVARRRIPALVSAPHSALTQASSPWIFRVSLSWAYRARAIVNFGVATLRKERWAVVYGSDATGIDCKDRIVAELKEHGLAPVAAASIDGKTRSPGAAVAAVRNARADIVAGCIGRGEVVRELAKELRRQGVTADLIGSNNMSSPPSRGSVHGALEGAYSTASFLESASPAARDYARRIRERSRTGRVESGWAYDSVRLLAAAMNKAGSTNADAVRAALLGIRGYQGVTGVFNFDVHGEGLHSVNIVRNVQEKRVLVQRMAFEPRE